VFRCRPDSISCGYRYPAVDGMQQQRSVVVAAVVEESLPLTNHHKAYGCAVVADPDDHAEAWVALDAWLDGTEHALVPVAVVGATYIAGAGVEVFAYVQYAASAEHDTAVAGDNVVVRGAGVVEVDDSAEETEPLAHWARFRSIDSVVFCVPPIVPIVFVSDTNTIT